MISESGVLFSIQPRYMRMILNGDKLIEFRNTYWKVSYPSLFYVYESKPISKIKYSIVLGEPYSLGELIPIKYESYGTQRFNNQNTQRKFAYPILQVNLIIPDVSLGEMRDLGITPPQNYLYISRFKKLSKLLTGRYMTTFEQGRLF